MHGGGCTEGPTGNLSPLPPTTKLALNFVGTIAQEFVLSCPPNCDNCVRFFLAIATLQNVSGIYSISTTRDSDNHGNVTRHHVLTLVTGAAALSYC